MFTPVLHRVQNLIRRIKRSIIERKAIKNGKHVYNPVSSGQLFVDMRMSLVSFSEFLLTLEVRTEDDELCTDVVKTANEIGAEIKAASESMKVLINKYSDLLGDFDFK